MDVKNIYPHIKLRSRFWKVFCFIYNIVFVLCIFILPLINFLVKGKAWSVVALFSMFAVWRIFITPSQFEINRTDETLKSLIYILILLGLIEVFLVGGWAITVIPIICFVGITIAFILFISDLEGQKHHSLTFIFFLLLCIAAGLVGIFLDSVKEKWVFIVLASVAFAALVTTILTLKTTIIEDFKKKISVK